MVLNVTAKPGPVALHLEEVVLLHALFRLAVVVRTLAVDELLVGQVALASHTVESAVLAEVDVALVVYLLQHREDHGFVAFLRRPDEVVVADVERPPRLVEAVAESVDVDLGRHPLALRRLEDFLAVLVGSGEGESLIAVKAVIARQKIRHHRGVGVADVGFAGGVVDRCGHVETLCHFLPRCHRSPFIRPAGSLRSASASSPADPPPGPRTHSPPT